MTYQAYRIIIEIDDDATEFAVPETIVERIESTQVIQVRGIQLLGVPKTKLREKVASLEHSVDHLVSELHALQEWRKEHSAIDVGAIVDDRLGPLERRFAGLRDDLAESRRVGADIVETWANHQHRTTEGEFSHVDPDTGLRSAGIRGLTSKPVTP